MARSVGVILTALCCTLTWSCNLADPQPRTQTTDSESSDSGTDISDITDTNRRDSASDSEETDSELADVTDDDASPGCQAPQERCGNECVNTQTDPQNCGQCNARCAPPPNTVVASCTAGDCVFECQEGYFDINGDIISDGCESACAADATEICGDDEDNDCDGAADEGCECDPGNTRPCGSSSGACEEGEQTCGSDASWSDCEGQETGSSDICNGIDDDCDGETDEGVTETFWLDSDDDSYGESGSTQQSCSGTGNYTATRAGDCDDSDPNVNPGEDETCNGVDDDCDGQVDEGVLTTYYLDEDGDGHGAPNQSTQACSPTGDYTASQDNDCDDSDPNVNPGEDETCNGVDDDCDGQVDEGVLTTYYHDGDDDGYGDSGNSQQSCSPMGNYDTTQGGDCHDSDPTIHPGADDICNSTDDDCDGTYDEDGVVYHDGDGDTYGDPGDTRAGCSTAGDYVTNALDCDDTDGEVNPDAGEYCFDSSVDRNCDGNPACNDPSCDELYCQPPGGGEGYCVNNTCEPGGNCTTDNDCSNGLVCYQNCCCPDHSPCLCSI